MRRFTFLVLLALFVVAGPASQADSLLITGGILVDGTGAKSRRADVRVESDRIAAVGKLSPQPGERVLDARGKVIAPGFIDTHSHADGGLEKNPDAQTQIRQGITTAVVGQDGGSRSPLSDYFTAREAAPAALNLASFSGHGTARRSVLGDDYKRAATPAEIAKMRALVEADMRAGALGLSSGLEYDPGLYAQTDEVIALARVAGQFGGLYISHVRDEENDALQSFREVVRIAEGAHVPAQISHIKLGSSPVWNKTGDVFRLLDEAKKRGVDVSADVYPYTFWQSTITVIIPTRNWGDRAVWEKGLAEIGGPQNVLLTAYSPDKGWENKTLAQIATQTGKDAVTIVQEIVAKTHGDTPQTKGRESVVVTAMRDDDLRAFLADKRIMFCSDGGLSGSHPRGAGSFPRILGRYVREAKVLSLEEAVRKATSLPAARMGFADRGVLKPGAFADVVVFDPATVIDTATTQAPQSPPIGITHVLVNGVLVLDDNKTTGAHPGRVLRRRTAQATPAASLDLRR